MLDVLRDEVAQSELVLFWYKILDLVLVMVFLPKAYDMNFSFSNFTESRLFWYWYLDNNLVTILVFKFHKRILYLTYPIVLSYQTHVKFQRVWIFKILVNHIIHACVYCF